MTLLSGTAKVLPVSAVSGDIPPAPARDLGRNLPGATYTQLFGAEVTLAAVLEQLADASGPGLVCLQGPAGCGKAALAHACATRLAGQVPPLFHNIVWETLRPPPALGGLQNSLTPPAASTLDRLLDAIALQLGYIELVKLEFAKKEASLRARLKSAPYLIVLENFEVVADGAGLAKALASLAHPTKFLLTSRPQTLPSELVCTVPVGVLEVDAALGLLRYLALQHGLESLARADDGDLRALYRWSGGNPLALLLLAGLTASQAPAALAAELERLRPAAGDFGALYGRAWSALSADARWLLVRLLALPSGGGDAESVYTLAQLSPSRRTTALVELRRAALIMVGETPARFYHLHGLTQHFVMAEGVAEVEAQHAGLGVFREAVALAGRHMAAALRERASAEPLSSAERARYLEVLETCLDCDEVSDITTGLMRALHPEMVRAGLWRLWHDYILRAVEAARQHQEPAALGYMLMCRAELLALTGDLELAVARWQEARRYLTECGDEQALAQLECQWAKTCFPQGQWDKAKGLLDLALGRAERLNNPQLSAEVHHRLGEWHAKQSHLPEALEALERAQHFAAQAQWPRKEAEIWQTMALAAFQVGDCLVAKKRLETAVALVAGKPEGALPGQLHANLGLTEIYLGDLEAARRELEHGLAVASGLGDELTVCSCLNNLGLVAYELGRWAGARSYFLQSLETTERLGNTVAMITQLGNLGMLAVNQGEAEAALPYLRQALQLATAFNKVAEQAETEMWLSEAHWRLGQSDLALDLSQQGLAIAESLGHKSLLVQLSLRRGAWLREQAHLAEALECLLLARVAASPDAWETHPLRVLAEIGRVHLQARSAAALQDVLVEMRSLALEIKDQRLHVVYHTFLGEVALAQVDYAGFCAHFEQALTVAASTDNDWFKKLQRETRASLEKLLAQLDPAARAECEARLAAWR